MPPVSDFVHAPEGTEPNGSGDEIRNLLLEHAAAPQPRTCPPPACTSHASVRSLLERVMDLRAINDYRQDILVAIQAATDPEVVTSKLRQLRLLDSAANGHTEALAGALDEIAERLRNAEAIQNWDDLKGEEFTGTEIANRIKACLDCIRDPATTGVALADARDDLAPWFARYDMATLTGKTIAYVLGKKRVEQLQEEREMWERARKVAAT